MVSDSPAEKSNLLYMYDELLAVNGKDVSQMDHGDIVALIKSSGLIIHLSVQQPEDLDLVNRQQMVINSTVANNLSSPYLHVDQYMLLCGEECV